jgi:heme A synthase
VKKLGLHRFAVAVSLWVLILVAGGSVVTTEGAARAIPDWPLAFGRLFPESHNSLVLLALVHRYLAVIGFMLVIALAAAVFRTTHAAGIRRMAVASVLLMLLQVVLGGFDVLTNAADWIGVAHALVAQLQLLPLAAVALLSRPGLDNSDRVQDYGWPSLRTLALWTPSLVFVQIALGALYRHHVIGLVPHIAGAMFFGGAVLLFALFGFTQFPQHSSLRALSIWVLLTLAVQIALGVTTYAIGAANEGQAVPSLASSLIVATHVAVAGVLLVSCSLLAAQVRRCVLPKLAHPARVEAVS